MRIRGLGDTLNLDPTSCASLHARKGLNEVDPMNSPPESRKSSSALRKDLHSDWPRLLPQRGFSWGPGGLTFKLADHITAV